MKTDFKGEYFTKKEIRPQKSDKESKILPWLQERISGIEIKDNEIINKETQFPIRLFVNGMEPPRKSYSKLIDILITSVIEKADIITYTFENDYFAGAIDIRLVEYKKPAI